MPFRIGQVGIAAVIDEATGYRKVRGNDDIRIHLGRYIADGLRKWLKPFQTRFLPNWTSFVATNLRQDKRPQYYGPG